MSLPLRSRQSRLEQDADEQGLLGGELADLHAGGWTRIPYDEIASRLSEYRKKAFQLATDVAHRRVSLRKASETATDVAYRKLALTVVGAVLLVVCVVTGYWSFRGWAAYRDLTRPHHELHASIADATDGKRVVRPFFAPTGQDSVSEVAVGVTIWFREGVDPPRPEWAVMRLPSGADDEGDDQNEWKWMHAIEADRIAEGEGGFTSKEAEGQHDWESVWSGQTLSGSVTTTKQDTVQVKLPGRIVHSLVTNPLSRLIATFVLIPKSPLSSVASSYSHTSTRTATRYGPNRSWPLSWAAPSSLSANSESLGTFLAHSSAGYNLRVAHNVWSYDAISPIDQHLVFVASRTWLTMAADYPAYKLDSFKRAMDDLRRQRDDCGNRTRSWYMHGRECYRTFSHDGHFENLLEEKRPGGTVWKYGPFLTTRLSAAAVEDLYKLPNASSLKRVKPSDVEDVFFNWKLAYSAVSPAKLALAKNVVGHTREHYNPMWTDLEQAKTQDYLELFNALLGHNFNPKAHPIARGFVGSLAMALRYLSVPFILHYWATRHVSTGLAISVLTLQFFSDLIYHIVQSAFHWDDVFVFAFVLKIIVFVLLILKQLQLWTRFEVQFEHFVPVAVRFRPATLGERRSKQVEKQLDWKVQAALALIVFSLLRFGPAPPPLVRTTQYEDTLRRWRGEGPGPTALFWYRFVDPFQSTIWLLSRLSQIHLNYSNHTFAGLYGISAYLFFTSLLLSHTTTLLVGWFGRAAFMQPFTAWDLLTLVVEGTVLVQSRILPRVAQKEELGLGQL